MSDVTHGLSQYEMNVFRYLLTHIVIVCKSRDTSLLGDGGNLHFSIIAHILMILFSCDCNENLKTENFCSLKCYSEINLNNC